MRGLAAADARRRADAYAAALGLRVTGIAWVAEPGLRRPVRQRRLHAHGRHEVASAGRAGEPEVIDVTPDEITVDAAVDVAFTFAAAG